MIDRGESYPRRSDVNTRFKITVGIKGEKKDALSNVRHTSGSSVLAAIRFGFAFFGMALALDAAAESIREEVLTNAPVGKTRLTSTEGTRLFSNVLDRGEVQNLPGISAATDWQSDGTFVSRWWTEENPASDASDTRAVKQEVTGRWRTERGLWRVTFDSKIKPDLSFAEV